MKHFGDITKINGADVPIVDIVCGGSPCQDLSVAGKRAGLAGERSGLFMEQIRVIREMRNESIEQLRSSGSDVDLRLVRPRYMVWENVPGAFSSNGGEDFRAVLEETARVADPDAVIPGLEGGRWTPSGCIMGDGWSIAWRVHDAQFWGVPQRRRRIALVADFGGETAPEILFERESVSRDPAESGETREAVAGTVTDSAGAAISFLERAGCDGWVKESLSSESGQAPCQHSTTSQSSEPILLESNQNHATIQTDGISTALPASAGMGGGYVPMVTDAICLQGNGIDRADTAGCNGKGWTEGVAYTLNTIDRPAVLPKAYGISSYDSNAMKSSNPHSGVYEADTARTLDLNGGSPACNQGGVAIVCSHGIDGDIARTLTSRMDGSICPDRGPDLVLKKSYSHAIGYSQDAYDKYEQTEQGASLKASGGNYGGGTENLVIQ